MFDLLVIGGGLAGTTAALAARQQGARVAVASRGYGATALSNGGLDVAYSPFLSPARHQPRSIAEHVMDIAAHRPRHPYGLLGPEDSLAALEGAYALVSEALSDVGLPLSPLAVQAPNPLWPSALGTLQHVAAGPVALATLDMATCPGGTCLVLGEMDRAAFNAPRLAEGYAFDLRRFGRTDVSFAAHVVRPTDWHDIAAVDALARELPEGAMALVVGPSPSGRHPSALSRLSEATRLVVCEALATHPPVAGLALQQALERARATAAVVELGDVREMVSDGRRLTGAKCGDGLDVEAGAFVLASGRFVAGGVEFGRRPKEPLLDLDLCHDHGMLEEDDPSAVTRETPEESHPLMTGGIAVSPELAPQIEGRTAFANLRAAGMVLGGYASRYVRCADGVALATGYTAARGVLS